MLSYTIKEVVLSKCSVTGLIWKCVGGWLLKSVLKFLEHGVADKFFCFLGGAGYSLSRLFHSF